MHMPLDLDPALLDAWSVPRLARPLSSAEIDAHPDAARIRATINQLREAIGGEPDPGIDDMLERARDEGREEGEKEGKRSACIAIEKLLIRNPNASARDAAREVDWL